MKQSNFQFSNPRLLNICYSVNENFNNECVKFSIKNEVSKHLTEEKKHEALVSLKVTMGDQTENYPFFISLEIASFFKVEDDISDQDFDKLLEINAPAMLLSYARPMVSLITSQSGYPAFDIPFINFTE